MAKPDCDDGWTPYAHELDAALAAADFTKGARIVLREVFFQTFGTGPVGKTKLRPAAISASDYAQLTGLDKREIVRSLNHLVACHVLNRVDRGQYTFQKDYERWTWTDGSPRLSKVELSWCARTKELGIERKNAATKGKKSGVSTVPKTESPGVSTVPSRGYELSPAGGMNCPQNHESHYRNGREELEIREKRDEEKTTTPSLDLGAQNGSSTCPPLPDEETSAYITQTGAYDHDDVTTRRLFRLAWSLFPGTEIANEFWSFRRWHSADVWDASLRRAKRLKPGLDSLAYVKTVARDYQAKGIPTEKAPTLGQTYSKPATSAPAANVVRADPELRRALENQAKKPK